VRTIAIANQKGGVGKTTTAVSLAARLADMGHTVALIDLDPQANATMAFGVKPAPALPKLLMGWATLEESLVEVRDNLWLLPADRSLADVKAWLYAQEDDREYRLAQALAPLAVEFAVIDTAPSRDVLHTNAHYAAGQLIIPADLNLWALAGALLEEETVQRVTSRGHRLELLGVLPTFWERRTNETEANYRELIQRFGALVMPAVPQCTRVREAAARKRTIWDVLPEGHSVREAYGRLVRAVLHAG
jgi:chromosome partitioning protein